MFCKECGAPIQNDSKFCTVCGAAINTASPAPNVPHTEKKGKKGLWITLICVAAFIVTVLGAFLFIKISSGNPDYENGDYSDVTTLTASSTEPNDEFYGTWYPITGKDDHYIGVTSSGSLTVFYTSADKSSKISDFKCATPDEISVIIEGSIYTFKYSDGVLTRFKDGVSDGYTYTKKKTEEEESSIVSSASSEVESTPAPSEPEKPKDTAPKDIEYTLEHLKEAIKVWSNFGNYGAPCDFSDEYVYPEAYEFLNDSQVEWVVDLQPSECCVSVDDAKAHLSHYLDPNMYDNFSSDNFVEYRGILYIALGGVGYTEYDLNLTDASVTRTAHNKIYVVVKQYNSGGEYCCDTRIDFEYKNGAYKIVRVTDL